MVFPERHLNSPNHAALVKINNAIRSGLVRGFISEEVRNLRSHKKKRPSKVLRSKHRRRLQRIDSPFIEVVAFLRKADRQSCRVQI
jgi:hypothetical protein